MKNKLVIIIVLVVLFVLIIFPFWSNGTIPKQIAKISANIYLRKNFPKMQVKNLSVEWWSVYGDYIVSFEDENNERHGFCISPKYFPIYPGQGEFGIREEYREKYK